MKNKTPQRKANKTMTPNQLLNKAVLGVHNPKSADQKRHKDWEQAAKSGQNK